MFQERRPEEDCDAVQDVNASERPEIVSGTASISTVASTVASTASTGTTPPFGTTPKNTTKAKQSQKEGDRAGSDIERASTALHEATWEVLSKRGVDQIMGHQSLVRPRKSAHFRCREDDFVLFDDDE